MEKDEHPIPAIRLEEQSKAMSSAHTAVNHYPHPFKPTELTNAHLSLRGNDVATTMPPDMRIPRSRSSDNVSNFHSSDHRTRSSDPVSYSHSKMPTASPSTNSAASYTNPSNLSTLSSLGYVSEDPGYSGPSSLIRSAPNLSQHYPPRSMGSFGMTNGSSEGTFSSSGYNSLRPRMQKSLSQESAENPTQGQSSVRPTSLVLPNSGAPPSQAQQFFSCPNCKRTFSCNSNDTFEPWFNHIKTCGV